MFKSLMTLLFFPDWATGFPSDFLILHFFFGAILIPFIMINRRARNFDSQNPTRASNGYKDSDTTTFYGYEEIK